MTALYDMATPSEALVQGAKPIVPRRRARKKKEAPVVVNIKPHPLAWGLGLVLAEGNPRRLVTLSASEVLVANSDQR